MRRLRPLSEAECYARCYGGSDENVRVITLKRHERKRVVAVEGEALRMRFEQLLDGREPDALAEPEAA